jgi:hypothetical protein
MCSIRGDGMCRKDHALQALFLTPSHSLDVWVTSSGLLGPPSISDTSPDDLRKCFEANSMAPFFALKYAPPAMAKTTPKGNYPNAAPKDVKYGSIIVVSSVASTYGGCWGPCYTMTSHAALGVVRAGVATLKGIIPRRDQCHNNSVLTNLRKRSSDQLHKPWPNRYRGQSGGLRHAWDECPTTTC